MVANAAYSVLGPEDMIPRLLDILRSLAESPSSVGQRYDIVLEAKSEEKQPLVGKEQARRYARSQNCRFIMLSNGNLHYFWDLERGNPYIITSFPTPQSVTGYSKIQPNPQRLIDE